MEFDPKRAARVGAKKIRQRQDLRLAKKRMRTDVYDNDDCPNGDIEDPDSNFKDFILNVDQRINRKRDIND